MESFNPKRFKMGEEESCSTLTEENLEVDFDSSTSDFAVIAKRNAFVDKTLLLKAIFENKEKFILITAPRRFGKSTNMDMVRKFVEIQVDESGAVIDKENPGSNYNAFKDNNLLIYQHQDFFKQHFATYPVIQISFNSVSGDTFNEVLDNFRSALQKSFMQHPYLLNSKKLYSGEINIFKRYFDKELSQNLSKTEVSDGLEFLSSCLYKHFDKKQVFVLIDEYDDPINNTMFEKDVDINKVTRLLCNIFSKTFKGNRYVERALLTGIYYFATVGLSGANNIKKYMFLEDWANPFVEFYGLTKPEVDVLFCKFNVNKEKKEEARSYYNGYCTKKGHKLFSLWSILTFLETNYLQSYWEESGLAFGLRKALKVPVVKYAIEELFQDIPVRIKIMNKIVLEDIIKLKKVLEEPSNRKVSNPNLYLNFLLQQGYLTYTDEGGKPSLTEYERYIKIPNIEIHKEFKDKLTDYYTDSPSQIWQECAIVIDKISPTSDDKIYLELIEKFECVISDAENKILKENERMFHSLLMGVSYQGNSSIVDEYLLNNGNTPDLVLTNNNIGVIIEMKYKKGSDDALQQIIDRKYYEVFASDRFRNIVNKIYIGLNVSEDYKVTLGVLVNILDMENATYFPVPNM